MEDDLEPYQTVRLSESEVNRYKNIFAVQELIPKVFRQLLQWVTRDKPKNLSYLEYIEGYKNKTIRQLKKKYKFINRNVDIIRTETDVHNFDVSLLFPLIQVCCPGIRDSDDSVWEEEDESKIEVLLRLLKDHRNFVVHGREATSSDIFTLITRRLDALIKLSGQLFLPEDPSEIEKRRSELFRMMSRMFPPNQENIKIIRQKEFRISAWNEGKNYWTSSSYGRVFKQNRRAAPLANWYFPLDLTVIHSQNQSVVGSTKSSEQLLEEWFENDDARVTVVEGEAGAGKTTLASKVGYKFYADSKDDSHCSKKYHLLHYFECRDRTSKTIYEFMKFQYPTTCCKYDREDIENSFYYSDNLILVDGYDEDNETSSYTFKELLKNFEATSCGHMVITTRPHATKHLEILLQSSGLSYRISKLKDINSLKAQVNFLRKQEQCCENLRLGIVNKFRNLDSYSRGFFTSPFILVAFVSACSDNCYGNEMNAPSDIPHLILNEIQRNLCLKFREKGITNVEFLSQDLFSAFEKFAFYCLEQNLLIVAEDELQDLYSTLKQILEKYNCIHVIDTQHVVSTFLRCSLLPYSNHRYSYRFPHNIIMECLAARTVIKADQVNDEQSQLELKLSIGRNMQIKYKQQR